MENKKKSLLGYRDDSPYRDLPYIDINTPQGIIDMSGTGIFLKAKDNTGYSTVLPPYSGQHKFKGNTVRESPLGKTRNKINNFTNKINTMNNYMPLKFKYQTGGEQDQIAQVIQAYAQATGTNPDEIMQQLQGMSPQEQQQAIQAMMQELQGGQGGGQEEQQMAQYGGGYGNPQYYQEGGMPQEQMQPQGGGDDEIMQIVQAYAQMMGVDPNEIMEKLQALPPEQQQEVIQMMVQELQQGQGGGQQQAPQGPPQQMQQPPMQMGGYASPKKKKKRVAKKPTNFMFP